MLKSSELNFADILNILITHLTVLAIDKKALNALINESYLTRLFLAQSLNK
jgi:hypothetical protein